MNSPFYKETILWNELDVDLQRADNVMRFVNGLKMVRYQEIW